MAITIYGFDSQQFRGGDTFGRLSGSFTEGDIVCNDLFASPLEMRSNLTKRKELAT